VTCTDVPIVTLDAVGIDVSDALLHDAGGATENASAVEASKLPFGPPWFSTHGLT
jgi:hypothetical protein